MSAVWDAISANVTVTGTFNNNGRSMFMAFKYGNSNNYGMMISMKYSTSTLFLMTVNNGTKTVKAITAS